MPDIIRHPFVRSQTSVHPFHVGSEMKSAPQRVLSKIEGVETVLAGAMGRPMGM